MNIDNLEKTINHHLNQLLNDDEIIENVRIALLGKNGIIADAMNELKKLNDDDKKTYGKLINDLKIFAIEKINTVIEKNKVNKINSKIKNEIIDVSINLENKPLGSFNILSKTIDDVLLFFIQNGFKIIDGPEIESDFYCFEQVNMPKDHIARDMQDTFYFDETLLLRTHTSSNQIHEMEANKNKEDQLAIISPGKVYRRDTDDATHSHQFTQIEGMFIGKNVNLGNLKAILDGFIKSFYGIDREIRLRTSYFPFTEPSIEVDISCGICNKSGCSACKEEGWIEILGAGMIHPNVLKNGGYNPEKASGFAFGIGVERIAMLKYNIKDIRQIYNNDLETFEIFKGENI